MELGNTTIESKKSDEKEVLFKTEIGENNNYCINKPTLEDDEDDDEFNNGLMVKILTAILCIASVVLLFSSMVSLEKSVRHLKESVANIEQDIVEIKADLDQIEATIETLSANFARQDEMLNGYLDSMQDLQDMYNSGIQEQMLDTRYQYCLYDRYGQRTDITYEQLEYLCDIVEDSAIQDEDLILSIIMVESRGQEDAANSRSSAQGYAQFLDSTSKFAYCDLLGYEDWDRSVALDGKLCMEMMVAYFDYLYEYNNGDIYAVLRSYTGQQDISSYVSRLDYYLVNSNKTVQDIYIEHQRY